MLVNTLKVSAAVLATFLAGQAAAKTDLSGCVSSETVAYGGASLIWYVPDTGEICAFLDCGGGRAPPKTTVPGCGFYSGTATYTPSFLPGFGAEATSSASASATGGNSSPAETSAAVASSTTTAVGGDGASSGATTVVASVGSGSSSSSTITAAPSTSTLETSTTTAGSSSGGSSSSSAGGSQAAQSSGTSGSSSSSSSSSNSVSQGAAAMPTAAVKGAVGVVVGLVAGVAML